MSTTYFGRPEHDGRRRLGADLDLIANWSRNFALRTPVHSYHLSKLSAEDQAKLFSSDARQFRLRAGPNETVSLETVKDGDADRLVDDPYTVTLDRDMIAMMRTSNYGRSEARNYELLCQVEDAQEESQAISAQKLSDALMRGLDAETAKKLADKAASDVLVSAGRKVVSRWKAERLENLLAPDNATPYSPPPQPNSASITLDDVQFKTTPTPPLTVQPPSFQSAGFAGDQITSQPQHAVKPPSPHASTPGYGSETTVGLTDSSSPTYTTEEMSSPELEFADSFLEEADGGVGLMSYGITEEFADRGYEAVFQTPTLPSRYLDPRDETSGGHLGAGLTKALFALPTAANGMFTSNAVSGALATGDTLGVSMKPLGKVLFAMDGINPPAQTSDNAFDPFIGRISKPDAPAPVFSPERKTTKYPLAEKKPWLGFTCYDVPYKPRNDQLVPKYWTTKLGKERYVRHKISSLKSEDSRLRSDHVLGHVAREPIHIVVDLSNITIGFYNSMKEQRGIPEKKRIAAPAFSFKNFDTILTRDRNVAKRIVAGSLSNTHAKRWPDYMVEARDLGYEMNILQRVLKPASSPRKRKTKGGSRGAESPASGADTSGDDAFLQQMKQGEQGVDELLHLKILQSAMDTPKPSTMVLATGDAASAEYSDGFKKNIERVLAHGWNIELYGWRRNISSAWREPEFVEQWGRQFKIVELDDFCEELFDMTIESLEQ
ncbi:hypothetical protein N656DRAFT_802076 [Canariomyces notabilis]|uniref:Uncharacterized protein n=1 Tax=Canariomyces notabilis TaxID=2074819 RepID=A0AAN6QDK5_9PEZI|nr:hypothetical protein N656DRAFT_802076 [Canariomyces arenarius]